MRKYDAYFEYTPEGGKWGEFTIQMTGGQALSASHAGDCWDDSLELLRDPKIAAQLDEIGPEAIKQALLSTGGYGEKDLKDERANQARIVWIAACEIKEEFLS